MNRRRGFTLIEVILATTLFALLMSSYYVVFTRVSELEQYARDQREFGAIGPAILDLIEDDLLSLYTHPRQPDAYPFRGQDESLAGKPADRLLFVARRRSIRQEEFFGNDNWLRSPINEVGYRLARAPAELGQVRRLFRREAFYVDETPMQGGDYYEVYDRVISFNITYAGYPVEETERTDQDSLGERSLESFESWDSEERKGFPTAVIVTLIVEPPRMTLRERGDDLEKPKTRTFVRIIPLVHADDIPPPEPDGSSPTTPGTPPGR